MELVHTTYGVRLQFPLLEAHFFVKFIDDSSRKVWIYFLKHKSNVFDVFKKSLVQVENESGQKFKCLKSDKGTNIAIANLKSFARVGESIK